MIYQRSHSGKERPMLTRNVVLAEQQAGMIKRLVGSGRYQNASEGLRDGLRLVQQREAEDEARLVALRQAARAGLADCADGRYRSFADVEALRDHLATRAGKVLSQPSQRHEPRLDGSALRHGGGGL
jgi:antitoxin ParD1/3/4